MDLQSYRVVHLTGTVKLLHLPIEEQHVPNIFLGATMVSNREIFTDTQQVVVPPTRNFLTVEVTPDRDSYQPREEGTLTVTTRDDEGRPVSAEVALSLVDESVFYIQGDYAGDPRQFFFGSKRPNQIETQSTMNQKRYVKLIEVEDGGVRDQRELESAEGGGDGYEEFPEHGSMPRAQGMVTALSGRRLSLEAALPQPSGMPMLAKMAIADESQEQLGASLDAAEPPPGAPESAVVVRSDFRSTILWQPDLKTGRDGTATVKVTYPDSVTSWKATARAATDGNQFGMADAATRTKQPLIVRLQAPRFFVVGDEVVLSAVVNNNTEEALDVKVTLDIVGGLKPAPAAGSGAAQQWPARLLRVPAKGQVRADWKTRVTHPGDVTLQVTARGGSHSDAMKKAYPVFEHGIEKFISKSGKVRGDDITVTLDLPRERTPDSTTLTVQVTPSMAVTMLDALPYLIDYPYGCTEQTMSRFLPAVITAKTLKDLGMNSEDVMGRVFGGIEPQHTAATQPQGRQDLAKLSDMTQTGLDRLYDFQHGDGGWGWWKEGESDHWMTSYVVWGLSLARDAKVRVKEDVLSRARDYLAEEIVEEEENPDMQAFMLHALGAYYAPYADQLTSTSVPKALDNLWTKRDALNAYTRALLALSAHYFHREDQARILVENLENGVLRDDRPDTSVLVNPATRNPQSTAYILGTAHWGEDVIYWRWSDGGVEATAFALRALLAIDPKNPLVEPVANWLIKNRRGAQWSNTRDTAIVVLALNDYLRVSGELQSDIEFEVFVNGNSIAKRKIGGADVLKAPSRFIVDPKLVQDGANRVRIRRQGEGPVYFAAEATYFSLEEPIPAAGNEIFVKRQYFKWVGRPTLLKGYVYDRVPLLDGDSVASGDRVETVLTVEAKNNYEYLVFEDLKPAGFEAVELRSGQSLHAHQLKSGAVSTKPEVRTPDFGLDYTGKSRWVYQELRDRKVALFLDQLPEGVWEMRY
ncbi:MAG: alpha-2-macroglobulin, partial [Verrucomicrobia bacterium]|nr:alpha-2-macroglobulin [Verrucomicrobiota bacterium]